MMVRSVFTGEFSGKKKLILKLLNKKGKTGKIRDNLSNNWNVRMYTTRIRHRAELLPARLGPKTGFCSESACAETFKNDLRIGPAFLPSIANIILYQLVNREESILLPSMILKLN